jgi:hypothetical protein
MSARDILNEMVNAAPDQVGALESNIQSIDDQISDLTDEANAIEEAILEVDATALIIYLESTKVPSGGSLVLGADYNVTNITDWQVLDSTANPVYEYLGVGWDGDTYIIQLITDWAFGYDYLTRTLISGATYGIYPQISALSSAKSILEANKTKIEDSIDVLGRYI